MTEHEETPAETPAETPTEATGRDRIRDGFRALGVVHVGEALWMALAPGAFYDVVGGFPPENEHYIRDVSTFFLAIGVALWIAGTRHRWRIPILSLATLQYAIHTVNHIVDIGDADPSWLGPFNAVALGLFALVLALFLGYVVRDERAGGTTVA